MMMSTTAMEEATSLFPSFPNDIVLNILVSVPRRYHPILSCVSKKLQSIILSSELHKTRSLMGKDSFYVCFREYPSATYHWFTLIENRRLVSIPFPDPPQPYSAALMVGHEIFFVDLNYHSRSMWILDSRSGKLRQGPSMLVAKDSPAVGLVDDKIYIIGGWETKHEEIQAQVFDLKTQTWEIAANPSVEVQSILMSVVNPSLDRKIYAKNGDGQSIIVYDPRDGNCEFINLPLPADEFYYYTKDVCVIDNVLYIYKFYQGLMWYNPKDKNWRVVPGLDIIEYDDSWRFSMAEYNGKLALLWQDKKTMEIWCSMIALHWSGVAEVQGQLEWSNCILSDVPHYYRIIHCLGRTD